MDMNEIRGQLRGPAVLVMAPFTADYELDTQALHRTIRHAIDSGITKGKGFVICPSGTGEYISLSDDEHQQMVETAVEAAAGELPVVAGVATNFYKEAIARSRAAQRAGAVCVMSPPPYYYRGQTRETVFRWYETIAESIDIGLMIYSQPQRNLGNRLDIETIAELSKIPNVISIKRGQAPSLQDYIDTLDTFSDRFAIVDNSYGYTAGLAHMHGASSYITGLSAFWPEGEVAFWALLESGQYREAERLHAKQGPFWKFVDNDLGGFATSALKEGAEYVGLSARTVRPPFSDLTDEERKTLHGILDTMGVKPKVGIV